jgi:hypothetical protein
VIVYKGFIFLGIGHAMMMEAVGTSETSVNVHDGTWRSILEVIFIQPAART